MWKKLCSAGALAHTGTGMYCLFAGAAQADFVGCLYAALYAVGPGMVGLALCLLTGLINPPVRPVLVLEGDRNP